MMMPSSDIVIYHGNTVPPPPHDTLDNGTVMIGRKIIKVVNGEWQEKSMSSVCHLIKQLNSSYLSLCKDSFYQGNNKHPMILKEIL